MRTARIEAFQTTSSTKVLILVDIGGGELTPYEFDHLGDLIGAYLMTLGFNGYVGPKSIRTEMSDEELEAEFDDFSVVRRDGMEEVGSD